MKEVNLTDFITHTLTVATRLVKLCQGTNTAEGGKLMTDCLFLNRTYFYTQDTTLYSTIDCLIGAEVSSQHYIMAAELYKEGYFSTQSFLLTDPLHSVCTKITPALYEVYREELSDFFSKRFAITYYDHEHGFHSLSTPPLFRSFAVFSIEHLHQMLTEEIHEIVIAMKNCRRMNAYMFSLLNGTLTLKKEELMYGLLNSLLSADRYMKYTTLTVIETCSGAKRRTTIFQTYIESILIQLFDYQLCYDQLELAFLPSSTKDFLNHLAEQCKKDPDSMNCTYELQMQFIKEGLTKAIHAIWKIDLVDCAKKEQNLTQQGLFPFLETTLLPDTEERHAIYELLHVNPVSPSLLNYLYAAHPEESEPLSSLLYFFHYPEPVKDMIYSSFCKSLFPDSVLMFGSKGILRYIRSLSIGEIFKLQHAVLCAQKKYHYPSHKLTDTITNLMEERLHGQSHHS